MPKPLASACSLMPAVCSLLQAIWVSLWCLQACSCCSNSASRGQQQRHTPHVHNAASLAESTPGHRTYCPRLAEEIGERTAMDDLILRLPGRVLAEAREVELAQYVLDTLLKGGLFPGPFQAQEPAARLWVLLWRVSSAEVTVLILRCCSPLKYGVQTSPVSGAWQTMGGILAHELSRSSC